MKFPLDSHKSTHGEIEIRPSAGGFDWNGLPTKSGVNDEGDRFSCLGAFVDGKMVGSLIYQNMGDFLWLEHVYVIPDYRRRGIAESLVRRAMKENPGIPLEGNYRSSAMATLIRKIEGKMLRELINESLFELLKERLVQPVFSLKLLIKERIAEAMKDPKKKNQLYSQWLKSMLGNKKRNAPKGGNWEPMDPRAAEYFDIGFGPERTYYTWYWDAANKRIVKAMGGSHGENFGNEAYKTFRGRYDIKTKRLSLSVPDAQFVDKEWTEDIKKDVPKEVLVALQKEFPGAKVSYFPFKV